MLRVEVVEMLRVEIVEGRSITERIVHRAALNNLNPQLLNNYTFKNFSKMPYNFFFYFL